MSTYEEESTIHEPGWYGRGSAADGELSREPVSVAYHADGFGPARPAIDVKLHRPFHDDATYRDAYARLSASPFIGEEGADNLAEIAYDMLAAEFWIEAAAYALPIGLGPIEQEGRSGGWLVFTSSDPLDLPIGQRRAWLASYSQLRDWAAARIARAPRDVAELMLDMAADRGVTP